jgi:Mg-chelatase subunit ChlD
VVVIAIVIAKNTARRHVSRSDEPGISVPSELVEGVALAIVYDTSGSMAETVPSSGGATEPKFVIANRALLETVDQLDAWVRAGTDELPHQLECGLVRFAGTGSDEAVEFGPFDAQALRNWAAGFNRPDGATPLGRAIDRAGRLVLNSKMLHKHVLVITDGENTEGPSPAAALSKLRTAAAPAGAALAAHFLAFDVDADVFEDVKRGGASLVSAANGAELASHLHTIVEKEILLEVEDPPVAPAKR